MMQIIEREISKNLPEKEISKNLPEREISKNLPPPKPFAETPTKQETPPKKID